MRSIYKYSSLSEDIVNIISTYTLPLKENIKKIRNWSLKVLLDNTSSLREYLNCNIIRKEQAGGLYPFTNFKNARYIHVRISPDISFWTLRPKIK